MLSKEKQTKRILKIFRNKKYSDLSQDYKNQQFCSTDCYLLYWGYDIENNVGENIIELEDEEGKGEA